jgi:hypothetical protein
MRRLIAATAIAGVAVVVVRSYLFDDARVCRDAVADSSLVRLCGPVGLEEKHAD